MLVSSYVSGTTGSEHRRHRQLRRSAKAAAGQIFPRVVVSATALSCLGPATTPVASADPLGDIRGAVNNAGNQSIW